MTKSIRTYLLAFAILAGTAGATAAPALADDWGHDRDARTHEWRDRDWRYDRPPVAYAAAPYAYAYTYAAPAYDYYAPPSPPPPVVYAPPAASLSLTIPFNRR